jgi:putative ABC transport system ATP-binding protein
MSIKSLFLKTARQKHVAWSFMSYNGDKSVLEAHGLVKTFGAGDSQVNALRGIDLRVPAGQLLALIGPSGSGKSTLLNVLGGIEIPSEGSVRLDNTNLTALDDDALTLLRRRRIGFVFQAFNLLPTLTAAENTCFPLILDGVAPAEARKRAEGILGTLGLAARAGHYPGTLSGGEQQRVAIARALLINPALILADEPTGNLDSTNAQQIIELFRRLVAEMGKTVVVATHDLSVAHQADRVVLLCDGSIHGDLSGAEITLEKLEVLLKVGPK